MRWSSMERRNQQWRQFGETGVGPTRTVLDVQPMRFVAASTVGDGAWRVHGIVHDAPSARGA